MAKGHYTQHLLKIQRLQLRGRRAITFIAMAVTFIAMDISTCTTSFCECSMSVSIRLAWASERRPSHARTSREDCYFSLGIFDIYIYTCNIKINITQHLETKRLLNKLVTILEFHESTDNQETESKTA